jgi:hypothetical protein
LAAHLNALKEGFIEPAAMGENCSTKGPVQEALTLQFVQILPDRDHAYRKPISQIAYIQGAGFFKEI